MLSAKALNSPYLQYGKNNQNEKQVSCMMSVFLHYSSPVQAGLDLQPFKDFINFTLKTRFLFKVFFNLTLNSFQFWLLMFGLPSVKACVITITLKSLSILK